MMQQQRRRAAWAAAGWAWLGATGIILVRPALARQAAAPAPAIRAARVKKPITHDVYDRWRAIQGATISRDGTWVVYALVPQDGDGELIARNRQTNAEWRAPRGQNPAISADSKFVVFRIAPTKAETDKAKKEKKKPDEMPKSGLGILNLETGKTEIVERVKRGAFAEGSGRFVAFLREAPLPPPPSTNSPTTAPVANPAPPAAATGERRTRRQAAAGTAPAASSSPAAARRKEPGTELVVRDLSTGATALTVAEVADFAWNKPGTWLAYAVSSKTPEKDGVWAWQPNGSAQPVPLLSGRGSYKSLVFDEKGAQLAFLSDHEDRKKAAPEAKDAAENQAPGTAETSVFALYRWVSGDKTASQIVSAGTSGMPAGHVVSDNAAPRFSRDGARLFLGTAPAPAPKPKNAPEPVNVDIWASNDALLQPMQKVRADNERKRSFAAVWHVGDKKLVPLAAPAEMPDVNPDVHAARLVLGSGDLPYRQLVSWDQSYRDVFVVDLRNGARRKMLTRQPGAASLSPSGKYLIYWSEAAGAWLAQQTESDKPAVNLTGGLGVPFADEEHDTPDAPRPYGVAGWTKDDKTVLVYDRYDIWEISPNGARAARRLTEGRAGRLVFRYVRLDEDEIVIPTDKHLLLSATDDRTKASGYSRLAAPLSSTLRPSVVRLVMGDEAFGSLRKAKNADAVLFTRERFDTFPDLWTSALSNLSAMQKLSNANPQQADYVWGKSELIEYTNADGKKLRATLSRPDNFDPSKKYPLLVYIYEKLSDNLHRYVAPRPGTSINVSRYVSNGYVVLQPDIVYTTGYPGESALKCVLPAVQEVVRRGYIDPARVGIQGHSWGAYQITYLITRTDVFRAVEAGAAVADMVSAYGGIRWQTGMSRAFQYEKTQSRIGAAPWQKPLQYLENSPIFWADKVKTPYLSIHNDADGAVPWQQGIEFFSALRRLGKEAYLFNYNGEDHGLINRDNQKHWTVHQAEFFDHYLLNAPRPAWMDKGVPYLERGQRDLTSIYTPAASGQ